MTTDRPKYKGMTITQLRAEEIEHLGALMADKVLGYTLRNQTHLSNDRIRWRLVADRLAETMSLVAIMKRGRAAHNRRPT